MRIFHNTRLQGIYGNHVEALFHISVCNYGQEWEVSSTDAITPYRAGLDEEIHAHIEVKIGLRSVNITLKGSH